MRSIATVRSLLWSPRLPITQPARAGLGRTNGSAEDQSTPRGTRGRFGSPQRRSEIGDFSGRLARKTNGASSHVVAQTANGASSDVVLGELSPSSTKWLDDEVPWLQDADCGADVVSLYARGQRRPVDGRRPSAAQAGIVRPAHRRPRRCRIAAGPDRLNLSVAAGRMNYGPHTAACVA